MICLLIVLLQFEWYSVQTDSILGWQNGTGWLGEVYTLIKL